MNFAGFWRRFWALIVDSIIISVILSPFVFDHYLSTVEGVFSFAAVWAYFTLFKLSKLQATPGQRLLGIETIDIKGDKLTIEQLTLRHFMKIISAIFFIGYLMSLFTKKRQTLHDIVAGTVVVRSNFSGEKPEYKSKPERESVKAESSWSKKPRDVGFGNDEK